MRDCFNMRRRERNDSGADKYKGWESNKAERKGGEEYKI
jgi:hypothetical protein